MTTRTATGQAWSLETPVRTFPSIKGERAFLSIGIVLSAVALGLADLYPSLLWLGGVALAANAAAAIAIARQSTSQR